MKKQQNLINIGLQKPNSSLQEILYHMIKHGSVSIISHVWMSGFRARISNLRLDHNLPMIDKADFGINKHGRKFRYVVHILENEHLETAIKIYKKLQKEETK